MTHVDAAARGQQRSWQQSGSCGGEYDRGLSCRFHYAFWYISAKLLCLYLYIFGYIYFLLLSCLLLDAFWSVPVQLSCSFLNISSWFFAKLSCLLLHALYHISAMLRLAFLGYVPCLPSSYNCLHHILLHLTLYLTSSALVMALEFCKGDFPQLSRILYRSF